LFYVKKGNEVPLARQQWLSGGSGSGNGTEHVPVRLLGDLDLHGVVTR
jgi:hypothetical protein